MANNLPMAKLPALAVLIYILIIISGCAANHAARTEYDKPLINVIIEPQRNLKSYGDSIAVFNFNVAQANAEGYAYVLAEYLQMKLLQRKLLPAIELTGSGYQDVGAAIEFGKKQGFDLILIASVDNFFWGGISTDSKAGLTLKIVDVRSSATLWFVHGYIAGKYTKYHDHIFTQSQSKPAPAPEFLIQMVLDEIVDILASCQR